MRYYKLTIIVPCLWLIHTNYSWASSLPQLDIYQYPRVIFWLILNLILLFLFINYVVIPKIANIQNTRCSKILSNLEKTTRSEKEHDKILLNIKEQKQKIEKYSNALWDAIYKKINIISKQKSTEFNTEKQIQKKLTLEKIQLYNNKIEEQQQHIIKEALLLITQKLHLDIAADNIDKYITKK